MSTTPELGELDAAIIFHNATGQMQLILPKADVVNVDAPCQGSTFAAVLCVELFNPANADILAMIEARVRSENDPSTKAH